MNNYITHKFVYFFLVKSRVAALPWAYSFVQLAPGPVGPIKLISNYEY